MQPIKAQAGDPGRHLILCPRGSNLIAGLIWPRKGRGSSPSDDVTNPLRTTATDTDCSSSSVSFRKFKSLLPRNSVRSVSEGPKESLACRGARKDGDGQHAASVGPGRLVQLLSSLRETDMDSERRARSGAGGKAWVV